MKLGFRVFLIKIFNIFVFEKGCKSFQTEHVIRYTLIFCQAHKLKNWEE